MHMKRFINKKVAAIGLAAGLVLGGAGAAFAYFTSTGSGTGTATTGSATNWTVSVPSTTHTDLTPVSTIGTGPSDTLSYSITNAGTGFQNLATATISVASVTAGPVSGPNACTANDFSVGGELAGVTHVTTIGTDEAGTSPGPAGVYNGTVSLQLVDNGQNQDQCQGATVTLKVVAN